MRDFGLSALGSSLLKTENRFPSFVLYVSKVSNYAHLCSRVGERARRARVASWSSSGLNVRTRYFHICLARAGSKVPTETSQGLCLNR